MHHYHILFTVFCTIVCTVSAGCAFAKEGCTEEQTDKSLLFELVEIYN